MLDTIPGFAIDLPSSSALLEALLGVSLSGVVLYKPMHGTDGIIEDLSFAYLNLAAQQMLCRPPDSGTTYRQHFSQDTDDQGDQGWNAHCQAITTGQLTHFELVCPGEGENKLLQVAAQRVEGVLLVSLCMAGSPSDATSAKQALDASKMSAPFHPGDLRVLASPGEDPRYDGAQQKLAATVPSALVNQQEAERQRSLLHTMFLEVPAPICILTGPAFLVEFVNPAYQRIFPNRPLLGQCLLVAVPELEATPIFMGAQQVYYTAGTQVVREVPLPVMHQPDDPAKEQFFTFTYQARHNAQGEVDGVLVFGQEVTDQVHARRVVEASEQRVRQMAHNVPAMIWVTNPEGYCLYLNQQWFTYTGQTEAEALGRGWMNAIHPACLERAKTTFENATIRQSAFHMTYQLRRTDGRYRWVLDTGLPRLSATGEFEGFVGTVIDIHEQKRAEQALHRLTQKLQASNQQLTRTNVDLDNFIYAASHDLKSPITNIEGLLHALQAQLPTEVQQTHDVAPLLYMMHDSIARFQRTIDYLSDVTKLQREYDQPRTDVVLAPILEDVRQDLLPLLQQTGAQLKLMVEDCPTISFSAKNLRSVLYNLLTNALKYRHPERVPQVLLQCYQQDQHTVLEVRDNGLGLDASQQQQLFTMFRRFHAHVDGSGIGLYMVKRSVENVGGKVAVKSELGEGSTFFVYFPR